MRHLWEENKRVGFWWGNLKEWKPQNDHGVDGRFDNGY